MERMLQSSTCEHTSARLMRVTNVSDGSRTNGHDSRLVDLPLSLLWNKQTTLGFLFSACVCVCVSGREGANSAWRVSLDYYNAQLLEPISLRARGPVADETYAMLMPARCISNGQHCYSRHADERVSTTHSHGMQPSESAQHTHTHSPFSNLSRIL